VKLVYVAGPYRAPTGWGIECNIVAARKLGAAVAQLGAFPVVPHANTAHYDGLAGDAFWLEGTLELLRRCDAVVLVDGWRDSSGTRGEVAEAERLGKMVFSSIDALADWIAYHRELEGK
jgi:hypothetical protein